MSIKLKRLVAKNFGSYRSLELDFEKMAPLSVVMGHNHDEPDGSSNGSGKSTLADVVPYLLFNKSIEDRQLGDLVNDNAGKGMLVEGWFEDGIKITRGRQPNKFVIEDLKLPEGERDITSLKGQKWLEEHWGIDWEAFKFIYRFGGGETGLTSYVRCSEDFRRRIQDALLQAPKITACLKTARAMKNDLVREVETLSQQIDHIQAEIQTETTEIDDMKSRLRVERKDIRQQIKDIQDFLDKADKLDLDKLYRVAERYTDLELSKKNQQTILASKQEALDELREEVGNVQESIQEFELSLRKLEEKGLVDNSSLTQVIETLKANLVKLKEQQDKVAERMQERDHIEADLSTIDYEIGGYNKTLSAFDTLQSKADEFGATKPKGQSPLELKYTEDQKSLEALLKDQDALSEKIKKLQNEIKGLGDPTSEHLQVKKNLVNLQRSFDKEKRQVESIQDEIKRIEQMEPGVKCPTCHTEFDPKNAKNVTKELKTQIDAHESAMSEIQLDMDDATDQLTELEERMKQVSGLEANVSRVSSKLADLSDDVRDAKNNVEIGANQIAMINELRAEFKAAKKNVEQTKSQLEKAQSRKADLQKKLSQYQVEASYEESIQALQVEIGEKEVTLKFNNGENDSRKSRITELRSSIKSGQKQLDTLSSKVNKTQEEIRNLESEIESLIVQINGLQRSKGKPPRTKDQLDALKEKVSEKKKILSDLQERDKKHPLVQVIVDTEAKISSRETLLSNTQGKVRELEDQKPYLQFWIEAFDSDGIRSVAMRDLIDILNTQAAHYMEVISGSPVSFQFNDELIPELTRVDTGEPFEYRKCSGGQRKRINIAIAFAFLDTIRLAAGCDLNLFVVDEAADALDTLGMYGFSDALSELSQDNRRVLVISHNPTLVETLTGEGSGVINVHYQNGDSWIEQE